VGVGLLAAAVGQGEVAKLNDFIMLERRFSVAPLMDWTGTSRKVKHDQ